MAFDGKATYDDFDSIHEDVSDIVSINSPTETHLLDALGNPERAVGSTQHDWLEDALFSKTDTVVDGGDGWDNSQTTCGVADGTKFQINDIILVNEELCFVSGVSGNNLTCTRGYGSTSGAAQAENSIVYLLGNAATEGGDADTPKTTNRTRVANYTQIIRSRTIKVSLTTSRVSMIGGDEEYDHQKAQRTVEVMRDLESFLISSDQHASTPGGADDVPRTMKGIKFFLSSNVTDLSAAAITEATLMSELQQAWENGATDMDLLVCGAFNKRTISSFKASTNHPVQRDQAGNTIGDVVTTIESDFGTIRVLPPNRWIPKDEILILSSRWIQVMPQVSGSFQHIEIAPGGSYRKGYIEGEYTCEVRHEDAHIWIKNTSTA
jgi:hypothetical protein